MSGTDSDDLDPAVDRVSLGHSGVAPAGPTGKGWITLRFRIILEYDGPSLSDTSSLTGSLRDLDMNQEDGESAYTYDSSTSGLRASQTGSGSLSSDWGYRRRRVRDEVIKEESERGSTEGSLSASSQLDDGRLDDPNVHTQVQPYISYRRAAEQDPLPDNRQPLPRRLSSISTSGSSISLTSSELGARWIEEQKARAARKIHGNSASSSRSSGGSSIRAEESEGVRAGTDYERGEGVLVLKFDGRGRKSGYRVDDMVFNRSANVMGAR